MHHTAESQAVLGSLRSEVCAFACGERPRLELAQLELAARFRPGPGIHNGHTGHVACKPSEARLWQQHS